MKKIIDINSAPEALQARFSEMTESSDYIRRGLTNVATLIQQSLNDEWYDPELGYPQEVLDCQAISEDKRVKLPKRWSTEIPELTEKVPSRVAHWLAVKEKYVKKNTAQARGKLAPLSPREILAESMNNFAVNGVTMRGHVNAYSRSSYTPDRKYDSTTFLFHSGESAPVTFVDFWDAVEEEIRETNTLEAVQATLNPFSEKFDTSWALNRYGWVGVPTPKETDRTLVPVFLKLLCKGYDPSFLLG